MTRETILAAIDHEAATPETAAPCKAPDLQTYAHGNYKCTRGPHDDGVHVATDDTGAILAIWHD